MVDTGVRDMARGMYLVVVLRVLLEYSVVIIIMGIKDLIFFLFQILQFIEGVPVY